ncbi:hypothetical protein psal_cds_251 [Pandoravirus salinus]|uniref:Atrophin-1 incomplete domain containing protein n=1 Tax=Pandoravirus salinus TaxID=1349410 RepID=S4W0A8_9VIRU|nr:hypothetical protein psal_cds_251 [Pandoravirus salinus]AGO83807.1 hypothetical protein psal_cds_251 [Pandoravirus salinus]
MASASGAQATAGGVAPVGTITSSGFVPAVWTTAAPVRPPVIVSTTTSQSSTQQQQQQQQQYQQGQPLVSAPFLSPSASPAHGQPPAHLPQGAEGLYDPPLPPTGPYTLRCAEDVPVTGSLDPCVPRGWIRAFNTALVAAALGVTIYAGKSFDDIRGDDDPAIRREKMRLLGAGVSTVGVLLWPVMWDALAGYAIVAHHPLTLFGFAWPIIMSMLDLSYLAADKNSVQAQRVFGLGEVSSDANTLVGVAFAVGSLLVSQGNTRLADATIPLLMYALLLLIAFIVPIPTLDPDDYSGFITGAIQRTFFNYAMGFVIAGISINISGQTGRGLQSALQRLCLQGQARGQSN